MLKKVSLVVVALLATASLANANFSLSVSGSSLSLSTTNATTVENYGVWLIPIGGSINMSSATQIIDSDNADRLSNFLKTDTSDLDSTFWAAVAACGITEASVGSQIGFADLTNPAVPIPTFPQGVVLSGVVVTGATKVYALDGNFPTGSPADILASTTITPEPATLAVFGLGGLLIRRRTVK